MKLNYITGFFLVIFMLGCENYLEETLYGQLSPENLLHTEDGIEAVLTAAYGESYLDMINWQLAAPDWSTDILWQTGGGENVYAQKYINFTLDASEATLFSKIWSPNYRCIRNCNILLDNIENSNLESALIDSYKSEARFLRAISYISLYEAFGPVVLRKSDNDPLSMPRVSDAEMQQFIKDELLEVIPFLPTTGTEKSYGRITKEAAKAVLSKFYLNSKNWQESADVALEIINSEKYNLFPNYEDLFKVENEKNSEYIFVQPRTHRERNKSMDIMATAFPAGFKEHPRTGLVFQSNWANFASQYRILDGFYNSFEEGDKRKNLIISEYIDNAGNTISLLNANNTRPFKFWPDPNADGAAHGNDWPKIRYADILLSRAEALNELNGPNQESIDLINLVRARAGLSNLSLINFNSKDELRDHLVKERGWELYIEGHRRVDLIRMGKYIEFAQERGINADSHHLRYPIPQQALDSDNLLEQNEGY